MRWRSTIESVEEGEVSALAILETVLAMALSLGIVHWTGSWAHVLVSACVAPLLLLRTEQSTGLGLELFGKAKTQLIDRFNKYAPKNHLVYIPFAIITILPSYALVSFLCRITATLVTVFRAPLLSVHAIPVNWRRLSLMIDTGCPPEIMPGIEGSDRPDVVESLRFSAFRSVFSVDDLESVLEKVARGLLGFAIGVILFLPSFFYRFSLKSTSLVYLPLIWLVSGPKLSEGSQKDYVEDLVESAFERIARYWAVVVLGVFTLLPLTYIALQAAPPVWGRSGFIKDYFVPIEIINSWHVTRSLSAAIAIGVFCWAYEIVRKRIKKGHAPASWQVNLIWCLKMLQKACALWTIGCGIYLLAVTVKAEDLPQWRWLPVEVGAGTRVDRMLSPGIA